MGSYGFKTMETPLRLELLYFCYSVDNVHCGTSESSANQQEDICKMGTVTRETEGNWEQEKSDFALPLKWNLTLVLKVLTESRKAEEKGHHNDGDNSYHQLGMVAHACNPIHLGGQDWEDHGSRSAQGNRSRDPTSTNKS
jgi:hypothetical protein